MRVINNVPLRDHITPHYANLGLIKLPDIVKLNTCQLIYDHFVDKKPSNFTLASIGVRAGATRGAAAPPNFGQLSLFGQQEKMWAKPVFKDVSVVI